VARALDLRVKRVRKLERRGLRTARRLSRHGACGGASAAGGGAAPGRGGASGGRGAPVLAVSDLDEASGAAGAGSGGAAPDGAGGSDGSGDVRGESATRVVPQPGTGRPPSAVPGGTPVTVALALILLAALAGFATPQLRERMSGRPTSGRA
jgi:hypothetical protein